ncbi:PIN domain-like protein [Polychaeton citri CBS 116435]|uniref:PIN domain-like protein n=1 Tax=Polychaeton citri CBS 116435 TaxID=1314669 RepID=A0A9P4UKW4_9PEZI|nr:PIN domain-like protein [Polychaeton citri CBS 116435]
MGIQGLLPMLKSIHKPTHLRNFAGQTLGVDAYGWLHRGTVACAIELAQCRPTTKYVDFAMNRVRMLIHFGVKPYIVFDGDYLPSKSHTEHDRAARRRESKRLGLDLLKAGKISQAHLELQKAVDVTPGMARELIEELKAAGIDYVVSPYEADAQLAYLEKSGIINGIISEDSDLLVFGAKCLLTKLDQYGECIMINRQHFTACREISLIGWTDADFRTMAMLSGCDYLPGIDKMGLKTAHRMIRKHKTVERVVRTIQFDGKMKIPVGYLESFSKAERTFQYQWVFCPQQKRLVNLNTIPNDLAADQMPYIGGYVDPILAAGVAAGDLDPSSKGPLEFQHSRVSSIRKATVDQTPLGKQGKSIAEFFKPQRTPLAELDPNSFTPSPSQRQILHQYQRTSWSASQAPSLRSSLVRSNLQPEPSTEPRPTKRAFTAPSLSSKNSPKRQRLCSDGNILASMAGTNDPSFAKSRFFQGIDSKSSMDGRKRSAHRKAGSDFDVFNDDSIYDTGALGLASPIPQQQRQAKTQSRTDSEAKWQSCRHEQPIDPPPLPSFAVKPRANDDNEPAPKWGTRRKSIAILPPDSSLGGCQTDEEVPLAEQDGDIPSQPLTTQPDTDYESSCEQTLPFKDSGIVLVDDDESPDYPAGKVDVPNSSPVLMASVMPENQSRCLDQDQSAAGSPATFEEPFIPVTGSEDLIVPNSPEAESTEAKTTLKFDIGRFAFTG